MTAAEHQSVLKSRQTPLYRQAMWNLLVVFWRILTATLPLAAHPDNTANGLSFVTFCCVFLSWLILSTCFRVTSLAVGQSIWPMSVTQTWMILVDTLGRLFNNLFIQTTKRNIISTLLALCVGNPQKGIIIWKVFHVITSSRGEHWLLIAHVMLVYRGTLG